MKGVTREREDEIRTQPHADFTGPNRNGIQPGERYELSLRKLGAWLDAVLAYRVTLTEVAHGFVVRYHRRDMEPVFVERFFPHAEVAALRLGDLRLRRRLAGRLGTRLQGVGLDPGGYQDLFRALGHELDATGAWGVTVREESVEGTLTLWCETTDGRYETTLGSSERASLRLQARSRRNERGSWRPWRRR